MSRVDRCLPLLRGALGVLLLASCSSRTPLQIAIPNASPTVELTQVPAAADTLGTYVYEVSWAGFDPDGRIAGFRYAVDPPSAANAETAWVATKRNRETFVFRSDSVGAAGSPRARGFHTVAVQAIDDRGAVSPVAHASFTSTTVAPIVQFTSPLPSSLLQREVASSVRLGFTGHDPDGVGEKRPTYYRWRLFSGSSEIPLAVILSDPDTLRRRFAPSFADWDSLGELASSVELRGLTPGQSFLVVVVAFDAAGAFSPVFSTSENMMMIRVSSSATLGPRLTVRGPTFEFTYPGGGFFIDPSSWIRTEFAARVPTPLSWSASTVPGTFVRSYRWAVDLRSLDDETPRTDEATDLERWSQRTVQTNATLPAYDPSALEGSESHTFYLEAEDDLGNLSLAVVFFTVVRPVFDRDLLVIDDTWLTVDRASTGGCVAVPGGLWPSAAELDTFLYAVGDKPYRCYPSGTRSTAGLFAGYAFDTLGTHLVSPDQLSLRNLSHYRNIVWMTDITSALTFELQANTPIRPMPRLREWCSPGAQNPLLVWIMQGGKLWFMGGGAALASLRPYDKPGTPISVYSSSLGELGPGRIMYDRVRWRSEITLNRTPRFLRSERAIADDGVALPYSSLPPSLDAKTLETDPLPLQRPGAVHASSTVAEYLSLPNFVHEGLGAGVYAALDTLYETGGGDAGTGRPVMTYYHGQDGPPLVFSGFPLWYIQRTQAIQVVDFVLQQMWGLQRRPVPR
jgi:hypothetical protein